MKNFFVLLLVVAITLTLSVSAFATQHNFKGWFSIDVPTGWTVERNGEDMFVRVMSPNGSESITFEYASVEEMDSRTFADNASGKLGGGDTQSENIYGAFEFTLQGGASAQALMKGSVGIVMKSTQGFNNLHSILESFGSL